MPSRQPPHACSYHRIGCRATDPQRRAGTPRQLATVDAARRHPKHPRETARGQSTDQHQRHLSQRSTNLGTREYWATPQETLSRGQGDCEDLAIAKYFTLLNMGIANSQLRLTQVKALQAKSAHMVLAYYSSPEAQPLILDNLTSQILPASQRHDLLTVYAFNAEGIYLSNKPSAKASQPLSLLSRWTALSARMRKQDSSALRL